MNSRIMAFIITMIALGNILSLVPIGLTRIGQVGFDLSHVATFIVALYGGPLAGLVTAFAGGIAAGIYFGPMGWLSWLGLIGLPIGKSLTGFASGTLFRSLNVSKKAHPSLFTIAVVLVGYVPEFLFTIFFFLALVPYFFGWVNLPLLVSIAVKAWMEMIIMSALMGALIGNNGFNAFMSTFFNSGKTR